MKPLNAPERRKAFLNFLLFFTITFTIIIITAYFSTRVPLKQNEALIKETSIANSERLILDKFAGSMQVTTNLVDSITKADNIFKIGKDLDNHFKEMNDMAAETAWSKDICDKIIDNLVSLRVAKEQLRNANNSVIELEKKDALIKEWEARSQKWEDRYYEVAGKK